MALKPEVKRTGAPARLIVKGVALTVTGFLASIGMTFVCLISGYIQMAGQRELAFYQEMPGALYAAFFIAMIVWMVIAVRFAWRNRTWVGMILSAIAFSVFSFYALQVLRYAYPVCNPF